MGALLARAGGGIMVCSRDSQGPGRWCAHWSEQAPGPGDLRTEFETHKKREGRLSPPLIPIYQVPRRILLHTTDQHGLQTWYA